MPNVGMVVTKVRQSEVAEVTAEESTSMTLSLSSTGAAVPELRDCSSVDMRSRQEIGICGTDASRPAICGF